MCGENVVICKKENVVFIGFFQKAAGVKTPKASRTTAAAATQSSFETS
jgi:hypothetical protein